MYIHVHVCVHCREYLYSYTEFKSYNTRVIREEHLERGNNLLHYSHVKSSRLIIISTSVTWTVQLLPKKQSAITPPHPNYKSTQVWCISFHYDYYMCTCAYM